MKKNGVADRTVEGMTTTDWIIDIALILIVFRQLREERLTARTVLLPVVLMAWAGFTYLRGVPAAGNDLVVIGLLTAVGVVFGLSSGLLTRVRYSSGSVYIRATAGAAAPGRRLHHRRRPHDHDPGAAGPG